MSLYKKSFLKLLDLSPAEIEDLLRLAADLKAKKKFASQNSAFRSDPRDTYTVSYAGQTDWGGMEAHIKGFYTITDGDLMIEVNALKDIFCITFQLINKDPKPLELFCELMKQEGLPYKVSERYTRYMPKIKLP